MTSFSPTPSQTIGPFFHFGTDWLAPPAGGPITIMGHVFDGGGDPVPDALLEFWQADEHGKLDGGRFTRCLTDQTGHYSLATVKPGWVDDRQSPHIDVSVFARGLLQRLVTRIYFPDEGPMNLSDPVLERVAPERRATLVAVATADGALQYDVHLQGQQETVFFAW